MAKPAKRATTAPTSVALSGRRLGFPQVATVQVTPRTPSISEGMGSVGPAVL